MVAPVLLNTTNMNRDTNSSVLTKQLSFEGFEGQLSFEGFFLEKIRSLTVDHRDEGFLLMYWDLGWIKFKHNNKHEAHFVLETFSELSGSNRDSLELVLVGEEE